MVRHADGSARFVKLPTITPAVKPDGSCVFLTAEGKCQIHEVSPYGCAFFDHTIPSVQAQDETRRKASIAINSDMRTGLVLLIQYAQGKHVPEVRNDAPNVLFATIVLHLLDRENLNVEEEIYKAIAGIDGRQYLADAAAEAGGTTPDSGSAIQLQPEVRRDQRQEESQ